VFWGVKIGEKETSLFWIKPRKNWSCGLVLVSKQIFGSQKNYKPHKSDISSICPDAPNGATVLSFGVTGVITDIITHVKFCVNRFKGFWAVTPSLLSWVMTHYMTIYAAFITSICLHLYHLVLTFSSKFWENKIFIPGPEVVPSWMYRISVADLGPVLVKLVNFSLTWRRVPLVWKTAHITPVPKHLLSQEPEICDPFL